MNYPAAPIIQKYHYQYILEYCISSGGNKDKKSTRGCLKIFRRHL